MGADTEQKVEQCGLSVNKIKVDNLPLQSVECILANPSDTFHRHFNSHVQNG